MYRLGRDLGVGMDQGGDCPCPLGPETKIPMNTFELSEEQKRAQERRAQREILSIPIALAALRPDLVKPKHENPDDVQAL